MTNTSFSIKTVRRAVGSTGKKAVTKQKWPFLSQKQSSQRVDFAEAHKDWTVGDWKGLFGQMRPKSIILGVMGKIWVWKLPGEGLSAKLVSGWSSLEDVFWWSGAVGPGKDLGMQPKLMEGYMLTFSWAFWMMNFKNQSSITKKATWCPLPAGQWPQTQEQEGTEMTPRQWIWNCGVAPSISRCTSHWTPLASPQN